MFMSNPKSRIGNDKADQILKMWIWRWREFSAKKVEKRCISGEKLLTLRVNFDRCKQELRADGC